jgi:ParB family transcriptional regulator, chromosome partitioning protein
MNEELPITMIPVEKIHVLNPRSRNKKKFSQIVGSIANLGIKKPIKVSRRSENRDDAGYDLVYGQGRLEAFISLGQTTVPAIVVDVPREDRLLMSLVENLARRTPATMELVREVEALQQRQYTAAQIAKKIDISKSYVAGILRLLKNGERGLLRAVDRGRIPVHIAVEIATADDTGVQKALSEAYEKKMLTGKALMQARKIIEQRRSNGKVFGLGGRRIAPNQPSSSEALVRAYNHEAERQRVLIRKAKACETFLLFLVSALQQLFKDDEFRKLLQDETLDSLPKNIAERIWR